MHLTSGESDPAQIVLEPYAMSRVFTALLALLVACGNPTDPDVPGDDTEEPIDDPGDGTDPEPPPVVELRPGCTARAELAGYPTWLFFTRPDDPCNGTPGSGQDHHVLAELIRLIDSVPTGGRIDGHIFSITVDEVAQALVEAQTRGVDVRISTDGAVATSTDPAKTTYLDQLTSIVYCTSATNTACIATAAEAISHTKLFTFSTATAPDGAIADNVTWFGSANQTYASGMKLYNNTVSIYGDAPLFTMLRTYLDELAARTRIADYYDPDSGRGHLLATSADVYISPEAQTDLVVNRLDDVTPDATCEVRVMQASIRDSRLDVVDQLVRMKRGGCTVTAVADTVEPAALAALKAGGIPVREMPIHDKVFLVSGTFGTAHAHRVYTGSHNLSGGSAHRFDEIFVNLAPEPDAAHPIYDAYVTHFDDAFSKGTPL
jgi:hypothetical protein